MPLNRLTKLAKTILANLGDVETVFCRDIVTTLQESGGSAAHILQKNKIKFDLSKEILVSELLQGAYYSAANLNHTYIGTEHLLYSTVKIAASDDLEKVKEEIIKLVKSGRGENSSGEARGSTLIVDTYGKNLNSILMDKPKGLVYRKEFEELVTVLLQKEDSNVVLVGDEGVGKHSLVEMLAHEINLLNVPTSLANATVIEFDLISFMTSNFNKMGLDIGFLALAEELKGYQGVILSIKDFQNMFFSTAAGVSVPMFYTLFKSFLETSGVKLLVTMDQMLFDRLQTESPQMLSGLSPIFIDETNEDITKNILKVDALELQVYHNVIIPDNVVSYVYDKANSTLKGIRFPQKGIILLDRACAVLTREQRVLPEQYRKLVDKSYKYLKEIDKNLSASDFEKAKKTKSNYSKLDKELSVLEKGFTSNVSLTLTKNYVDMALNQLDLGDNKTPRNQKIDISNLSRIATKMKERIIGQDAAIDKLIKSVIRSKLGLRDDHRPTGNFMFLGPTGVGKTELAKVFADLVYEGALIRLDMSDFAEKHTVARLVGSPPGYVGYGENGELTQKIDDTPESVVLFDEMEKAHPEVLNILLQIMEEGELTDAKGIAHDFSKSTVILTSNLGTEILHSTDIGFDSTMNISDQKKVESRLIDNLKKKMKPELVNRLDEVIVFKQLQKNDQMQIMDIYLSQLRAKLKKQNVNFRISKDSREKLLNDGYSVEYGARQLRRILETNLIDKIADFLVKNRDRPQNIAVSIKNGELVLN